jgi:hypothetical protein
MQYAYIEYIRTRRKLFDFGKSSLFTRNVTNIQKLAVPGHALLWLILVNCKRSVSSLLLVSAVQHTFG